MRFTIDTDKVPLLIPDGMDYRSGEESADAVHDSYRAKLMASNKSIEKIEDTDRAENGASVIYTWQVFYHDGRKPLCKLVVKEKGGRWFPATYLDFTL